MINDVDLHWKHSFRATQVVKTPLKINAEVENDLTCTIVLRRFRVAFIDVVSSGPTIKQSNQNPTIRSIIKISSIIENDTRIVQATQIQCNLTSENSSSTNGW